MCNSNGAEASACVDTKEPDRSLVEETSCECLPFFCSADKHQSVYIEGALVWQGARSNRVLRLIKWPDVLSKTFLDLRCSNGMVAIEAKEQGAKYDLGVDLGDSVTFAAQLAQRHGLDIDFWKADIDSREFHVFAPPRFDYVFYRANSQTLEHSERIFDFLDSRTKLILYYETDLESDVEEHLKAMCKWTSFQSIKNIGVSELGENKQPLYSVIRGIRAGKEIIKDYESLPVAFLPVDQIYLGVKSVDDFKRSSEKKYLGERAHVDRVKESIQRIGLKTPLWVYEYKDGWKVSEGGHRFLAMKELGYVSVPCRVLEK